MSSAVYLVYLVYIVYLCITVTSSGSLLQECAKGSYSVVFSHEHQIWRCTPVFVGAVGGGSAPPRNLHEGGSAPPRPAFLGGQRPPQAKIFLRGLRPRNLPPPNFDPQLHPWVPVRFRLLALATGSSIVFVTVSSTLPGYRSSTVIHS